MRRALAACDRMIMALCKRATAELFARASGQALEIDYVQLNHAAWQTRKHGQGTALRVAFKHRAEWFRSVLLDEFRKGPSRGCQSHVAAHRW